MAEFKAAARGVIFGLSSMDEPSEFLDSRGKQELIRIIIERTSDYPVTLFISHDEEMKREFPNRIEFAQGPDEETILQKAA